MTEESSTFVRRKFTITEILDQKLQEIATRHYQGNVSLCLRAAIESHREILEGDGQFAAQRIMQQLGVLQQDIQVLQVDLGDIQEVAFAEGAKDNLGSQSAVWSVQMSDGMLAIIEILKENRPPLRLEDLLEQTELDLPQFQESIARLVDLGIVVETVDGHQRYGLAGQTSPLQNLEDDNDE